jgi:hypothetical protein
MQPLLDSIGEGPFFTLVAGVTIVLGLVAISIIRNKGMGWRLCREARRVAISEEQRKQKLGTKVKPEGNEREETINEGKVV